VINKSFPTDDSVVEIFNKYSKMVYKIAFSQTKSESDADDVFQDVFLQYIKNDRDFDSDEHEKAWFIRVTINCSRKLWSSAWHRHTVSLDENILFEADEEYDIYYAINSLSVQQRLVIHLFYYEDMTTAQISEALKIKESTIRTQLTRARTLLKDKLKGEYDYV